MVRTGRTPYVLAVVVVAAAGAARAQDGGVDSGPLPAPVASPVAVVVDGGVMAGGVGAVDPALPEVPVLHSFQTAQTLAGKVGTGFNFVDVEPYGLRTGYGQLFFQADWESIAGSGIGLHFDGDVRTNLFEPRTPCAVDTNTGAYLKSGDACDSAPFLNDLPSVFYENVGVVPTGRYNDYLRIDRASVSWANDFMRIDVGRMLIAAAAQAQVDGADLSFKLGTFGRIGAFGGLKPNPWHPQVVGAVSGGSIPTVTGDYPPATWGTTLEYRSRPDQPYLWGAYGNDLLYVPGVPWLSFGSTKFVTTGLYSSWKAGPLTTDAALVGDLFELGLDGVWGYTSGAVRLLDSMTVAWRTSVDIVGPRPLLPSQAFLDWTWRDLGPVTLSTTYFKINTTATALSYARYFAPLEDPDGVTKDDAKLRLHPALVDLPNFPPEFRQTRSVNTIRDLVAKEGLNNTNVYIVDRDRFSAEIALALGGSLQMYLDGVFERRADKLYAVVDPGAAFGGVADGYAQYGSLFTCSYADTDPAKPSLNNPAIKTWTDLCKLGGTIGLRDPFLGGVGNFDASFTYLNGYQSSTTRLAGGVGISLSEVLYLEVGGGLELNNQEKVFVGTLGLVDATGAPVARPDPPYVSRDVNVYLVDASATWSIWQGLALEAAYVGFLEDIPLQGETGYSGLPPFIRRDPRQLYHSVLTRAVWRF